MAVSRTTAFTDDTEVTATGSAGRLLAVRIQSNPSQQNTIFLQIWDATNPNPGTTAPTMVLPIPATHASRRGGSKYHFAQGVLFATAITYLVTTTATGDTVPTSNDAIGAVTLYWEPI